MKINIAPIIFDHIKTLSDARTGRISALDLLMFYLLPISAGFISYFYKIKFSDDVIPQSIAVFSIFSALLFSVQVALFGIYTKKREDVDEFSEAFHKDRLIARRILVKETNSNISYLMVLSSISVTLFLSSLIFDRTDSFESAIAISIYLHFTLTLLMVMKRVYALFAKEYSID